ncbi:hypothetical protein HDV06_004253 [Boothiomyces sp. JEL0866]|nr:hypothetical protein HDV06_004253 [Boothiomyces sp. JEL0866]
MPNLSPVQATIVIKGFQPQFEHQYKTGPYRRSSIPTYIQKPVVSDVQVSRDIASSCPEQDLYIPTLKHCSPTQKKQVEKMINAENAQKEIIRFHKRRDSKCSNF